MSHIIPEGATLRKAVKWISAKCQEAHESNIIKLIIQSATRFNLSPKDEEFLRVFYRNKIEGEGKEVLFPEDPMTSSQSHSQK